jgi:hypothetical protein
MFCVADRLSCERRCGEQCDEVTSSTPVPVARPPPLLGGAICRAVAVFGVHRSSARTLQANAPALASAREATEGVQRAERRRRARETRAGGLATRGPRSRAAGRLHDAGGRSHPPPPTLGMTAWTIACTVDPAAARRTGKAHNGVGAGRPRRCGTRLSPPWTAVNAGSRSDETFGEVSSEGFGEMTIGSAPVR